MRVERSTLVGLNPPSSGLRDSDDRNIGMLMDWREMAGEPTFRRLHGEERWSSFTGAWSQGRKVAEGPRYMGTDGRGDYLRGWILAACWVCASVAEYVVRAYSVDRTSPPCSL
jgi:hypothetical protein